MVDEMSVPRDVHVDERGAPDKYYNRVVGGKHSHRWGFPPETPPKAPPVYTPSPAKPPPPPPPEEPKKKDNRWLYTFLALLALLLLLLLMPDPAPPLCDEPLVCPLPKDCKGVEGGLAVVDDCGVCDGRNLDKGCDGVCFSGRNPDCAGKCGGNSTRDARGTCCGMGDRGCDGICFSGLKRNACGQCAPPCAPPPPPPTCMTPPAPTCNSCRSNYYVPVQQQPFGAASGGSAPWFHG